MNEAVVLKSCLLDSNRSLVLICGVRKGEPERYIVGIVGPGGELTDDALHVQLESAQSDFVARCSLYGLSPGDDPTAA
jgi:hypothetical protein